MSRSSEIVRDMLYGEQNRRYPDLVRPASLGSFVAQEFASRPPDWDVVVHDFLGSRLHQAHAYHADNLPSILAEFACRRQIAAICDRHPDELAFAPIPDGAISGPYRFTNYDGRLMVIDRYTKNDRTDYDIVILCNRVPVAMEVKLGGSTGRAMHGKGKTLKDMIRPAYLTEFTAPLKHYFMTQKNGVVVILYPERKNKLGPFQRDFVKRGGILMRFWEDRQTYFARVKELALTHGLLTENDYHHLVSKQMNL